MLRASLALLLICASATVLAQNGRGAQANATSCQEIADKAVETPSPVEPARVRATAVRSKYAQPAAAAPAGIPAAPRGGGGDGDNALPRSRGSKWHSFLPGMFR